MTLPLKLAIEITADAAGATRGTRAYRAELDGLGESAKGAAGAMAEMARADEATASAGTKAATSSDTVTRALADQERAATDATRALGQLAARQREALTSAAANRNGLSAVVINRNIGVRDDFGGAARADDIAAFGSAMDELRAKYNPLFAAQREYLAKLAEIRDAEKKGALSAKEAAAAITAEKTAFAGRVTAINAPGKTGWASLRQDQKFAVTRQIPDVVQSVALGMPFSQVALQQGPQVVDGLGGIGNALKLVGSAITPVTAGIGLLTGAVVLGTAAWLDYRGKVKEAEVAATAFGAANGVTATGIERIAVAAADAGDISVATARAIGVELTRTGRLGTDQMSGLIAITKDFAAVMGTDVAGASSKLGQIFADPAKGAEQLRATGLLDGATERLVKRLTDQNRTVEAGNVLLAAVKPRLEGAGDATNFLGRAAEWAGKKWDNLWTSVGKAVDRLSGGGDKSLEGQLAAAQERLARMDATFQPGDRGYDRRKAARDALVAEIASLQDQVRVQQEAQAKKARDDALGSKAISVADASGANAQTLERIRLQNSIKQMEDGLGKPGVTADENARISEALEAQRRALAALNDQQRISNELLQIDAQLQLERDPARKADLAARRTMLELQSQEISEAQLNLKVDEARRKSLTESATAAASAARQMMESQADQMDLARMELALAGERDDVRARGIALLQAEQQIRQQMIPAQSAEAQAIRQQAVALADLQTRTAATSAARQTLQSQRDQIEAARLDISMMGQSEQARARAVALLQAEQQIRQQLIPAQSAEAQAIRAQAVALADLNTERARQSDAWSTFTSVGERSFDAIADNLVSNGNAFKSWGDIVKSVLSDIASTMLKMAVLNPLKNALFGTNLGTMSDLQGGGGLIGQLLGGLGLGKVTGAALSPSVAVSSVMSSSAAGGNALAALRAKFDQELSNPATLDKLFAMTHAEVGGQGAQAQQAFMETLLNRAASRGMSLDGVLSQSAYFPQATFDKAGSVMGSPQLAAQYSPLLAQVRNGSNIANFATGNASGSVGFAGGPQTAAYGGERFGVEGPDMGWAAAQTQQFGTSLGQATNATSQFGSGLTNVAQQATQAVDGASSAFSSAGSGIQNFTGAAQDATAATGNFASGLGDALNDLMGSIGGALKGAGDGLGGFFGSIFSGGGAAFAAGGIMTSAGPLPLRAYSKGGVANSPQLSLFGEGRQPEAYVPLPDGRTIPVTLRGGSGGQAQGSGGGVNVQIINATGAQVRQSTTQTADGGQVTRVEIGDLIDQHMAGDFRNGGNITQMLGRRFGLSAAGGLT